MPGPNVDSMDIFIALVNKEREEYVVSDEEYKKVYRKLIRKFSVEAGRRIE